MDLRKVFVIYDTEKYTSDMILQDMRDEGFNHEFKLWTDVPFKHAEHYLRGADEVWVFGYVDDIMHYQLAKKLGKDFWVMS